MHNARLPTARLYRDNIQGINGENVDFVLHEKRNDFPTFLKETLVQLLILLHSLKS